MRVMCVMRVTCVTDFWHEKVCYKCVNASRMSCWPLGLILSLHIRFLLELIARLAPLEPPSLYFFLNSPSVILPFLLLQGGQSN